MIPFIELVAREAGREAMEYFNSIKPNTVSNKSPRDLVSTADRAVEKKIIGLIRQKYPDHCIFGEESGLSGADSENFRWVIDPIDGTQSFVKHHPYFSISIALKKKGRTVAGCVYAPALNLLFSAEEGKGAFENGKPIHPSSCSTIETSACCTGFACLRSHLEVNNLHYFNRLVPLIRDIKRCGSAALDLAFVASGRYDAYWELNLQEYDVAAGAFIALVAGASVCDISGGDDYPAKGILAATKTLLPQFLPYFKN